LIRCVRRSSRPIGLTVPTRKYAQVTHNPRFIIHHLNQTAASLHANKHLDKACMLLVKAVEICKTYTKPSCFMDTTETKPQNNQGRILDPKYLIMSLASLAHAQSDSGKKEEAKKRTLNLFLLQESLTIEMISHKS